MALGVDVFLESQGMVFGGGERMRVTGGDTNGLCQKMEEKNEESWVEIGHPLCMEQGP